MRLIRTWVTKLINGQIRRFLRIPNSLIVRKTEEWLLRFEEVCAGNCLNICLRMRHLGLGGDLFNRCWLGHVGI